MSTEEPFGYHFILDIYGCNKQKLNSIEECYKYLDAIPGIIGTDKQAPPYVVITDAQKYPDKAGISGWIPVVDSGISIHTLVPKRFATIDIYTCKKFSLEILREFTQDFFEPEKIEEKFFTRGEEYFK